MKSVSRVVSILCLTFLCGIVSPFHMKEARANNVKIGYIDLQRTIKESKQGKEKRDEIEKIVKAKQEEIKGLGTEIQDMEKELKEKELILSDEAREEMGEKIQNKLVNLKRVQDDAKTKLQKLQRKSIGRIMKAVAIVVKSFAKEKNYTMIVNSLDENFLYLDSKIDITDNVIEILNRQ